ncbi:MAG: type II toxin-antitoxin system VapC family toxin [Acidobacteriaceae bacterium]
MRTALDTNILSALWSREPLASAIAKQLGEAKHQGALLLSAVVYAELLAYPNATEHFVNDFLAQTGVKVDFHFEDATWIESGRRFARYAKRRRQSARESPKRLLADFLVGSHALLQADRLMTLDPSRYKQDFPELRLYSAAPL